MLKLEFYQFHQYKVSVSYNPVAIKKEELREDEIDSRESRATF